MHSICHKGDIIQEYINLLKMLNAQECSYVGILNMPIRFSEYRYVLSFYLSNSLSK